MPGNWKLRGFTALVAILGAFTAASSANAADARFEGISTDGKVAFFSTTDRLVPGDTDNKRDVYERSFDESIGGYVTREVSIGPTGGNNAFDSFYLAANATGDEAFFSTAERLTSEDKDNSTDIYVRNLAENKTYLVSGGDASCASSGCGNANSPVIALPEGVVAGGEKVFFVTDEALTTADTDTTADVYMRNLSTDTTMLVSTPDSSCVPPACDGSAQAASFEGASSDGARAFFTTKEQLVPQDVDGQTDIYMRDLQTGVTKLVTPAGTCPATLDCTPVFAGASSEGSHVYFETNERLSAEDTDDFQDVYEWSAGSVSLASTGPAGGNGGSNALYAGSAPNGSGVFFETNEALTGADTDSGQDVYERSGSTTSLVSAPAAGCEPPSCGGGNLDASVVRSNGVPRGVYADGTKVFFFSAEPLAPEDQDSAFDVYVRDLTAGTTTLVSQADSSCTESSCGTGNVNANLAGASADGSHAFFVTEEPLSNQDTDQQKDVYDRHGGTTTLVSTGSINGNGAYGAQVQGVSSDGLRAFFVTHERLTEEDDLLGEEDVYERTPSGTVLVSRGNDAEVESLLAPPPPTLERTDPASPGPSTEPHVIGSDAEAASSIRIYASEDCSGEPVAVGSAEELAEPGIAVTVAEGATVRLRATAEAEGFTSECSAPIEYAQRAEKPTEEGGGGGGTEGSGGGSTGSVGSVSGPTGGGSGGEAPKPGGKAYVTPVTRITFGPASKTRNRSPVFRFTDATGQDGTTFLCTVDHGRWRRCSSPTKLKKLRRGRHVFRVLGVNAAGVREPHPASRRFKVVPRR